MKQNFITKNKALLFIILFGTAVMYVITRSELAGNGATEQVQTASNSQSGTAQDAADAPNQDITAMLKAHGYTAGTPTIVDFYAVWCGPCKQMAPHISAIAEEYSGKLKVIKIDIDQEEALAKAAEIQAVPTLLIIDRNGKTDKHVGALSAEELESLARYLTDEKHS